VNKGLTFLRRRPRTGEPGVPKLAKDLLYLRDLAAGGDAVITAVTRDLDAVAQSGPQGADAVREAAMNLRMATDGHLSHHLAATAQMVVARGSPGSPALEEARTRAFLLDIYELLSDTADRHAPISPSVPPDDN
jgi:hypothetical protein